VRARLAGPARGIGRSRRGVSPIIATILLVAVTVVLAAVLYLLVSGMFSNSGSGTHPLYVGFPKETPSTGTPPAVYYLFAISPSPGMATNEFGVTLTTDSGVGIPVSAGVACVGPFMGCAAPAAAGGWYAVLVDSSGSALATYSSTGWNSTVPVPNSASLVLISNGSLSGSGDVFGVYGLSGHTVSGSTTV
jgi:flagellin-like protein